jgi:hypothetical protein
MKMLIGTDIVNQLNSSVVFNRSTNSKPTKKTERLSWFTISRVIRY